MNTEKWKPISGFDGYRVSNIGNVWSEKSNRMLSQWEDKDGYPVVGICRHKKVKFKKVHRLVAEAFCDGDRSLTVDHVNGNRSDNRYSNLEFVTIRENTIRGRKCLKKSDKTSAHVGVVWHESHRWQSHITYNKKRYYLITSTDEDRCAKCYNDARRAIESGRFDEFIRELRASR